MGYSNAGLKPCSIQNLSPNNDRDDGRHDQAALDDCLTRRLRYFANRPGAPIEGYATRALELKLAAESGGATSA